MPERVTLNEAKQALTDAHNLKWNFNYPSSPLFGLDPNPNAVEVGCHNCVGMCCTSPLLAGLSSNDQRVLLECGTVWDAYVFDVFGNIRDEEAACITEVHNRRCQVLRARGEIQMARRIKWANQIGLADNDANRNVIGPCGALTPEGKCGMYNSPDKPELCSAFEEGGPDCRSRFVARGSEAAAKVEEVLNRAVPILATLSRAFLGHERTAQNFTFIPLDDIK